ncbi:hypothetical protein F4555_000631 [Mobiluncus mulieris]|nr:hypothetical protein [Mobiluncus mulieris]
MRAYRASSGAGYVTLIGESVKVAAYGVNGDTIVF